VTSQSDRFGIIPIVRNLILRFRISGSAKLTVRDDNASCNLPNGLAPWHHAWQCTISDSDLIIIRVAGPCQAQSLTVCQSESDLPCSAAGHSAAAQRLRLVTPERALALRSSGRRGRSTFKRFHQGQSVELERVSHMFCDHSVPTVSHTESRTLTFEL
jgi:hypothetical protein